MIQIVSSKTWTIFRAHPRFSYVIISLHKLPRIANVATYLSLSHFRGQKVVEGFLCHLRLDLFELLEGFLPLYNKTHFLN